MPAAAKVLGLLLAAIRGAWSRLSPSNDRNWRTEEAVLSFATIEGDWVGIHNIRNFHYRSRTDFTPAYYDKRFDLRELDSLDAVVCYWMGPHVAHVFLSFGFGGKDYLAISIEARKLQGQGYSTIKGFFRQYGLYYVVADERDLIRQRTNCRRNPTEDVYLYRVMVPPEKVRRMFLDYVRKINSLREHPEFYNTLTTNCTSNIWMHARVNPGLPPMSWKILLSGHVPEYLYEHGRLDTRLPFEELKRRSHINARAQAADTADDFSQRIRADVPLLPEGEGHLGARVLPPRGHAD